MALFKKGKTDEEKGFIMTADVAEQAIRGWAEYFENDEMHADPKLIKAVQKGRLEFDEESEKFKLKLRKAYALENGETLNRLTFSEPDGRMVRTSAKGSNMEKDQAEVSFKMVAAITGLPLGVLDRLSKRDLEDTMLVASFFG